MPTDALTERQILEERAFAAKHRELRKRLERRDVKSLSFGEVNVDGGVELHLDAVENDGTGYGYRTFPEYAKVPTANDRFLKDQPWPEIHHMMAFCRFRRPEDIPMEEIVAMTGLDDRIVDLLRRDGWFDPVRGGGDTHKAVERSVFIRVLSQLREQVQKQTGYIQRRRSQESPPAEHAANTSTRSPA